MSGGVACRCSGTVAEKKKNWRVYAYRRNYSAFNGYRYTPSDYSGVFCIACRSVWRTKAQYVDELEDMDLSKDI